MAWIAVDRSNTEKMFISKPVRDNEKGQWISSDGMEIVHVLKNGTIRALTNRGLGWGDDPIELKNLD